MLLLWGGLAATVDIVAGSATKIFFNNFIIRASNHRFNSPELRSWNRNKRSLDSTYKVSASRKGQAVSTVQLALRSTSAPRFRFITDHGKVSRVLV
jgi:hypothetical protein